MLSKPIVDRAKPKNKQYKVCDIDGLHLLISPKGTKSFYFRYAWYKKRFEIKIGKCPLISLAGVRKKRDYFSLTNVETVKSYFHLKSDLQIHPNSQSHTVKGCLSKAKLPQQAHYQI